MEGCGQYDRDVKPEHHSPITWLVSQFSALMHMSGISTHTFVLQSLAFRDAYDKLTEDRDDVGVGPEDRFMLEKVLLGTNSRSWISFKKVIL